MTFDQEPHGACRTPTTDRAADRRALRGLARRTAAPRSGRAIDDRARRRWRATPAAHRARPRRIVLLSDGGSTSGADPAERRPTAAARHIPIDTVALGTATADTIAVEGRDAHRDRAARPGAARPDRPRRDGRAFRVQDAARLDAVYRTLGAKLGHRTVQRPARGRLRRRRAGRCSSLGGSAVAVLVRAPHLTTATIEEPTWKRSTTTPLDSGVGRGAGREDARRALHEALHEVKRVIVGQDAMLERLLVSLLAGGHVLLEGVPGLAKTLTVKTLAAVLGGSFRRIQFTPDLVPADLVGTRIYRPDTATFETELGPVFANFLLADEINRAPAKVQSALLEVMQEQQVTIGGTTYPVPRPFLAMATQNPIESEGTYPLPEAQIDRFLMKIVVDYPTAGRGGRGGRAQPRRSRPRCARWSRSTTCSASRPRRARCSSTAT